MSKSAPERAPTTPWSSLEPYTQLLRALLPRMNSLSVFDPHGHMHWSSEMSVAPEIASVVAEAVKDSVREPGSFGVQRMAGSEPIYLFWLMADDAAVDAAPFVVVAISFRQNSDGEQRSFAFVHGLVKPALECLRRELLARHEILNLHSSLAEQDNDLEMLRFAGCPVVMGNADAVLKSNGWPVTLDCDSSGVAHAVREYAL